MTLPRGTFDLRSKNRILKSNQWHIATIIEASPSHYIHNVQSMLVSEPDPQKVNRLDERVQMDFQLALHE